MKTLDRLTALLAEHSGVAAERIGPGSTLAGDLDLDSLDRIELGLRLEETFGIRITDADLDRPELGTAGGLAAFVADAVA